MTGSKTAVAILKNVRVSPRKLNLIAQLIRGKVISKAADALLNSSKRIANDAYKTLMSAVANAQNNHNMDIDLLVVDEAYVGQAFVLKRSQARAKGRGVSIIKRFSNLTIIVRQQEVEA